MKEGKSAFKILSGKSTGNNIKMGLKKIGINMRNLVDLPQDRNYLRTLVKKRRPTILCNYLANDFKYI